MANYEQHASYPYPTIREAICEVRFPSDPTSFSSQFATFWSLAQRDYSALETHVDQLVNINPISSLSVPQVPNFRARFMLRHKLRSILVQVAAGSVTLNVPAPYLGWQTMEQDVQDVWQMTQEAFQPSSITGLSLRYIDALPQPEALIGAEGWLVPGHYLPAAIFGEKPPFSCQIQTNDQAGGNTVLSVGYENGVIAPTATLLVDFNRNINAPIETGMETVRERVNDMHENIWQVFNSVVGPHWRQMLKEGVK